MMSTVDEYIIVNKGRCEWRVSAGRMFSKETSGAKCPYKRDFVVSRDPKTKP